MTRLTLAPLVLAIAAACSSPVQPDAADLVGDIAIINPATATLGVHERQFICAPSSASTPCVNVSVRVTGNVYMQEANGTLREIPFSSIPMGVEVLAWTKGRILESFPSQAEAVKIIVKSPKGLTAAGAAK